MEQSTQFVEEQNRSLQGVTYFFRPLQSGVEGHRCRDPKMRGCQLIVWFGMDRGALSTAFSVSTLTCPLFILSTNLSKHLLCTTSDGEC